MEIMFYFTMYNTLFFRWNLKKKICGQMMDGKNIENKNEPVRWA